MGEKEKSVLEQLQENLAAIQKQLDDLKAEENKPEPSYNNISRQKSESIDYACKNLAEEMKEAFKETEGAMSVSITQVTRKEAHGFNSGVSTSIMSSTNIEELDEEGIAAALEPFTNPKRIAILKALYKENLTATEISMKTRCVGGQLYHHLNNLENAGLICKEGDKFTIKNGKHSFLPALYAVIGGMDIARAPKDPFEYESKTPVEPLKHAETVVAKGIEIPSKPAKPNSPDIIPIIYSDGDSTK